MVEDTSDETSRSYTNKGVNVTSGPLRAHRLSSEAGSSTTRSVTDIRNDIQNVLDLMGPSTPQITSVNTSSEADNEDSYNESISKCCTSKTSSRSKKSRNSTDYTYLSNNSVNMENLDSMKVILSDNLEDFQFSCCDHNTEFKIVHPQCRCSQSYIPMAAPKICEVACPANNAHMVVSKKRSLLDWIKSRSDFIMKKSNSGPCELYKINICGQEDDCAPPKRVVFDLVEGIPKPAHSTVATNTIRNPIEKLAQSPKEEDPSKHSYKDLKNLANQNMTHQEDNVTRIQKNIYYDSDGNKRVDFYYFDHGNAQYFNTTDTPPILKCEIIAEKTERYTTRFWAEIFATIHIGVSFIISFFLQFFKFLLYSIFRPLVVGSMQMSSDYLFKPCLTTSFNGLIQPFLIFLYNIATSFRDLCDPIAETFGYFCREIAVVFRAIRLCTYKRNVTDCDCSKQNKCEC